jgi:hypothetical protein
MTPEEVERFNRAQQIRSMASHHVQKALGDNAAVATERFTNVNPHWHGAYWEDILDEILNTDGFLEFTEDESIAWDVPSPFREYVIYSLYYVTRGKPTTEAVTELADRAIQSYEAEVARNNA